MRRSRGAIDLVIAAAIAAAVASGGLGLWIGHGWGKSDGADEVATLRGQLGTMTGDRNLAREIANGNASQLTSLRQTLDNERRTRQAQQARALEEMGKRDARIAALTEAANRRAETITKKAQADEDCADLRRLPVCAAVAERLWGDAATARPH
jgi:hypothetical protein